MSFVSSAIIGYFFGFALGVGCALAVMYSIYNGGYSRAVEDSLRTNKSQRFEKYLKKAILRLRREETLEVDRRQGETPLGP